MASIARTVRDLLTMAAFDCLPTRAKVWLIVCRHGDCRICPYHSPMLHRDPLT